MISEAITQEGEQVAGHSLIPLGDLGSIPPARSMFIFVLVVVSIAIMIIGVAASIGSGRASGFIGSMIVAIAVLLVALIYKRIRTVYAENKEMKLIVGHINNKYGTAFPAYDERYVFHGDTHARDKRFKRVTLIFDHKNHKVLVFGSRAGQNIDMPCFIEDYRYLAEVQFGSKGGSTTSGAMVVASVAVPFSHTVKPTYEVTIFLRDPELVEVRHVFLISNERDVTAKFRQIATLISS
jgi:hypothetical protein